MGFFLIYPRADRELRDWGGRIARTVEGEPDRAVAVDRTTA
jgi:hypothetical protein